MELAYALAMFSKFEGCELIAPVEKLRKMEKNFLKNMSTVAMWVASTFLWSLAELNYKPSEEFMDSMFQYNGPIQTLTTLLPRHLAQVMSALGKIEYMPSFTVWMLLRQRIKGIVQIFPLHETIHTMVGLAGLDKCHRPDMESWYTDEHEDDDPFLHSAPSVSLMELLWERFRNLLVTGKRNID